MSHADELASLVWQAEASTRKAQTPKLKKSTLSYQEHNFAQGTFSACAEEASLGGQGCGLASATCGPSLGPSFAHMQPQVSHL